jgi:hypothetical protein
MAAKSSKDEVTLGTETQIWDEPGCQSGLVGNNVGQGPEDVFAAPLKRHLRSRHLQMIAIGGASRFDVQLIVRLTSGQELLDPVCWWARAMPSTRPVQLVF